MLNTRPLKGWWTIIVAILVFLNGGAMDAGLYTPEIGAQMNEATQEAVQATWDTAAKWQYAIGVIFAALRGITTSAIFRSR